MNKSLILDIITFVSRLISWILPIFIALILLKPSGAELKTILLVIVFECIAIALSGLAVFAYTKLNFVHKEAFACIGRIFLGVHITVGLIVVGVYIAQLGNNM